VVRHDGLPAPLESSEIESIRAIVQSKLQAEPFQDFVRGQQVLISDGPLHGVTGTLIETRKGPRLVVSVDLLCRSVLVEIDREWAIPTDNCSTVERNASYQTLGSPR
jgi:transcription antitermination factor NusG